MKTERESKRNREIETEGTETGRTKERVKSVLCAVHRAIYIS